MNRGNERFRQGKESPHDYLAQQKETAKGQYSAAVVPSRRGRDDVFGRPFREEL